MAGLGRLVRRLLDRLPHDTLYVGAKPYMRRWYVFGYAPDPVDVDARMICATCRETLHRLAADGPWHHRIGGYPIKLDHEPQPISAPREGWWWQDHGIGAVRVHEILASDDSRAFHDHPWDFAAIGLTGSYVEETPGPAPLGVYCPRPGRRTNFRRRFTAPFVNVKRATDLHVLTVDGGPVWTVFLTRPKVRSWGFADPFGWLGWREFDARNPKRDAWTETGA